MDRTTVAPNVHQSSKLDPMKEINISPHPHFVALNMSKISSANTVAPSTTEFSLNAPLANRIPRKSLETIARTVPLDHQ